MVSHSPMTIDHAMRSILRDFLIRTETSANLVVSGTGPDDIHDLRVANRRTRTLLSQVPGVFDKGTTKEFMSGFKRIGTVTGKCRDLDVWLDTIREEQESSSPNNLIGLQSFERLIQGKRDEARLQLRASIGQPWFKNLLDAWRLFLDAVPPGPLSPQAARSAIEAASAAILKAHQRLLRHGRALADEPTASAMHRLRIDGKKLRYLLESFGEFFDLQRDSDRIEDLKRLQDVLGEINDRRVQLLALDSLDQFGAFSDPPLRLAVDLHRGYLLRSLKTLQSSFVDEFKIISDEDAVRSFQCPFEQPEHS